jgi:DNA-binding PadR family transcriptional regulator
VRYLVLDALSAQPRHGYEVIQAIGEKSRGAYKPSPGVVYPTLQMLEELGLARTVAQGDRKVYEITDEGRRDLHAHADEIAEFYEGSSYGWEQHTDDVAHVMKRVGRVMHLFKRALHRGSVRPSTMRKMRSILDEALTSAWSKGCGVCRRVYDTSGWGALAPISTLPPDRVQAHLSVPADWAVELRRCVCGAVLATRRA